MTKVKQALVEWRADKAGLIHIALAHPRRLRSDGENVIAISFEILDVNDESTIDQPQLIFSRIE